MNTRIQFELPEDKVRDLEELMKEAGISTRKDLFNNALTLLEWIVKEKKSGRIIASIDEENGKFKELVIPMLLSIRTKPQPAAQPLDDVKLVNAAT